MVNRWFQKIEIPTDKNKIKNMIKEYDLQVDDIKNANKNKKNDKKAKNVIITVILLFVMGSFYLTDVNIVIKLIYTVPLSIFGIYYIILDKKKNQELNMRKVIYEQNIILFLISCLLFLNATFSLEGVLFSKWGNKEHSIKLCILLICCCICFIIAKFDSPKRFNKEFINGGRYKSIDRKVINSMKIAIGVVTAITCRNTPYFILLMISYLLMITLFQLVLYAIYKYSQYDYIQELKEEYKV